MIHDGQYVSIFIDLIQKSLKISLELSNFNKCPRIVEEMYVSRFAVKSLFRKTRLRENSWFSLDIITFMFWYH